MEKIKVNMSPNPLDVQTIHASQNDGEARQWEFELHNNGELIDTSGITEQMVFKSYKGGTEQILPENGSTPTTSPFLGDIKYPQGLLDDQSFSYRQSPTEEDGLAKITDIKGNTLNWNQLLQSLAPTTTRSGVTFTKNNDGTWTLNGTATANIDFRFDQTNTLISNPRTYYANHKYLLKVNKVNGVRLSIMQQTTWAEPLSTSRNTGAYDMQTLSQTYENMFAYFFVTSETSFNNVVLKPQLFDLTQMGLDSITADEFTSLFSLPYYSYNQGSLLSFNGNGIKTTGKNLLKTNISSETINGVTFTVNKDENGELTEIIVSGTATQRANLYVLPQGTNNVLSTGRYILSCGFGSQNIYMSSYNTTTGLSYRDFGSGAEVPYVTGEDYSIYISVLAGATANNIIFKPMLRLIDVEDSTFEPYTSSTLSLPISTYFPNGMKSAGTVYDELTESKATTRIGSVDLGTLNWEILGTVGVSHLFLARTGVNSANDNMQQCDRNIKISSSKYTPVASWNSISMDKSNMAYGVYETQVRISDSNYTTIETFKASLSGVYLNYELANPTETSFTTASLVTENAEIPLSNNDGVLIGKCTEQLSENPGFIDAKIKLSDADGECYSNKLQLHVERSPQ